MSTRLSRWDEAGDFWRLYGYLARALALRRAVRWGTWGLFLGLFATVLAAAAWRLLSRDLPPLVGLFSPALVSGLIGLLAGYAWRERPERAVRMADSRMDLKERLTTALEMVRAGGAHPLAAVQVRDAVDHFSRTDPLEAFPVRVPVRGGNLVVIFALLLLVVALAPNPFSTPQSPADRGREAAKVEAEKLDQLAQQIGQQQTPQSQQVQQMLQQAAAGLKDEQQDPEQSLAALGDLEDRLYRMGDADSQGLDAALAALAASLAGTPGQQDLAKRLATGDMRQVSRDLRRMAQDQRQMDQAQRAQLGRALQAAAKQAARSNQGFAQGLQQAGDALNNGQAQDASDQAQQALDNLANQTQGAANRDQALSQAQDSRANVARSMGQQPSSTARTQQSGTGDSQSQSGPQRGQGQTPGAGKGGQSQGSGQQQGQQAGGSQGDRQEGGDRTNGQPGGAGAGTGDQRGQDQVYDPYSAGSHAEQVPSQDQADPSEVSTDPYLSPAQQNGSQVGYRQVYGEYQQRATRNIEQSYVPLGLKDLVRQYFDELDPNKSGG